jgi:hypothetical protein
VELGLSRRGKKVTVFQNMVLKYIFETKVKEVTTYLTKFNIIL